jgi:hypothetical protein
MELDEIVKLFLFDSVWLQSTYSSSRDRLYLFTTDKSVYQVTAIIIVFGQCSD